jgi:hypothetical protein
MRVPPGVIAYEHNVEAMWPFPKFATQLIHVSETITRKRHAPLRFSAPHCGLTVWSWNIITTAVFDFSCQLYGAAMATQ